MIMDARMGLGKEENKGVKKRSVTMTTPALMRDAKPLFAPL